MPGLSFHPSLEGGQHGKKTLAEFVAFAKAAGCKGCQPSIYHIMKPDGSLMSARDILPLFEAEGMILDGISAHCISWVLLGAGLGTKGTWPFIPANMRKLGAEQMEAWAERILLELIGLCGELGLKTIPLFWGPLSWEVATGYPWSFFSFKDGEISDEYDLVKEGLDRFVVMTAKVREAARKAGIMLLHEIHPNTAAQCADDFLMLMKACSDDPCLGVFFDPSHMWQGETFEDALRKIGHLVGGCHVKDHRIVPGRPVRSMEADWKERGMEFTVLGHGDLDLVRFVELLIEFGYPERYAALTGRTSIPLVGEAESAFFAVDVTSQRSCAYIAENLCLELATGSFEDGMGA